MNDLQTKELDPVLSLRILANTLPAGIEQRLARLAPYLWIKLIGPMPYFGLLLYDLALQHSSASVLAQRAHCKKEIESGEMREWKRQRLSHVVPCWGDIYIQ